MILGLPLRKNDAKKTRVVSGLGSFWDQGGTGLENWTLQTLTMYNLRFGFYT